MIHTICELYARNKLTKLSVPILRILFSHIELELTIFQAEAKKSCNCRPSEVVLFSLHNHFPFLCILGLYADLSHQIMHALDRIDRPITSASVV